MAVATPSRSPPSRVRSLASMATSVPLPMAIPRSAWTSAGASLTPSPTIATVLPWACRRAISPTLSAGMTSASARSMPTLAAIAAAVVWLSPVSMATSRPMACSRATCSAAPGLSVSATASTPRTSPSQPAHTTVLPCRSSRSTAARTPAPTCARWRESRLRVDITVRAQPKQERHPMTDSSSSLGQRQAPEFDSSVPQTARIWNYWLGGKDYFPVDRAVGDQILEAFPAIVENARASRAFLVRAVRYLAGEAGIRQFLDIGTGLPTANNTHQVAQAVAPECRIVYVDNDPLVLAHARALLTSSPEGATAYLDADLHEP